MSIKRIAAVTSAVLIAFSGTFVGGGLAQQDTPNSNPASGLRVSPPRSEETVNPGEEKEVPFNITNVTGGNIIVRNTISDFEANEDGSTKLIDNDEQSSSSIKPFVNALPDHELAAGESYDAVMTIRVGADTAPGAYYGVSVFEAVPVREGDAPGQLALSGSVGAVMLVSVPGQVTEKMQLISLKAGREVTVGVDSKEVRTSNLFSNPPTVIQTRVKNTGNSFVKPFGRISVENMSGKEVYSYEFNDNDPRSNVLPGTERVFKDELKNVNKMGRYTIVSGISYGDGGEILVQRSTFWVIPVWAGALFIVLVIALIFGVLWLVRRFKTRR